MTTTLIFVCYPTLSLIGILGDCWFLSALSIIANYDPKLIANLFLTCELNSSGAYQFKFCKNGEWKNIIIDDYLPCYLEKGSGVGKLSFSKSPTNALWVALIEKAYAKLHNVRKKKEKEKKNRTKKQSTTFCYLY